MTRASQTEILDEHGIPDKLVQRAYQDIATFHRWLGDTRCIVRAIRRDPLPIHQILDVGCGAGFVSREVERSPEITVAGADIHPHPSIAAPVEIIHADARCATL